jgi:hypothetical protein
MTNAACAALFTVYIPCLKERGVEQPGSSSGS